MLLLCSCEKKKDAIVIEKKVLNSIFVDVIDSIYFKLDSAKIITRNQSKFIVVNDSVNKLGMPNSAKIFRHFKGVNQVYLDTIFENAEYKINFKTLPKSHYTFIYSSTLPHSLDRINWQNYSLPGVLTFTKMHFDIEFKVAMLGVTYGNGSVWTSKEFYIYAKKRNENWIIDQVLLRDLIY
jgi:hypothetical protein